MKYLFDINNKRIRSLTPESNWTILTKMESKIVEVLSNGYLNNYEEIISYIQKYGHDVYDRYNVYKIRTLYVRICKLKKKIDLDIIYVENSGLILRDEIYIM